ncbi:MAG TPA: DUF3465 domain-containing protein [Candidatus Rubrimentiphilum sp.]|nr:DUF3465 domain-containing protein [Candidatus Rubrimentiphilum sp.]
MEVTFAGTVSSMPTYFFGTRTRCEHETFDVQTASGPIRVIDNVDIAPPVPVRPGDRVEVRGEMVHDRGSLPIVHWTHHDPQGRHVDGFIRLRGRVYA